MFEGVNRSGSKAGDRTTGNSSDKMRQFIEQAAIVSGLETTLEPGETLLKQVRGRLFFGGIAERTVSAKSPRFNVGLTDRRLILQHIHSTTGEPSELPPQYFPRNEIRSLTMKETGSENDELVGSMSVVIEDEQIIDILLDATFYEDGSALVEGFRGIKARIPSDAPHPMGMEDGDIPGKKQAFPKLAPLKEKPEAWKSVEELSNSTHQQNGARSPYDTDEEDGQASLEDSEPEAPRTLSLPKLTPMQDKPKSASPLGTINTGKVGDSAPLINKELHVSGVASAITEEWAGAKTDWDAKGFSLQTILGSTRGMRGMVVLTIIVLAVIGSGGLFWNYANTKWFTPKQIGSGHRGSMSPIDDAFQRPDAGVYDTVYPLTASPAIALERMVKTYKSINSLHAEIESEAHTILEDATGKPLQPQQNTPFHAITYEYHKDPDQLKVRIIYPTAGSVYHFLDGDLHVLYTEKNNTFEQWPQKGNLRKLSAAVRRKTKGFFSPIDFMLSGKTADGLINPQFQHPEIKHGKPCFKIVGSLTPAFLSTIGAQYQGTGGPAHTGDFIIWLNQSTYLMEAYEINLRWRNAKAPEIDTTFTMHVNISGRTIVNIINPELSSIGFQFFKPTGARRVENKKAPETHSP